MPDVRRLYQWLVLGAILICGCNSSATKEELMEQFVSRCQELEIRATMSRRGDAVEVFIGSPNMLNRLPISDSVEMVVNIEKVEPDFQSLEKLVSSANITEFRLVECVLSRGDIRALMESHSINRLLITKTSLQSASRANSNGFTSERRQSGRNLHYVQMKNVDFELADEILNVYGYPIKTLIEMPIAYELPHSSSLLNRLESLEVIGCKISSTMFDEEHDLFELTIVNSSIDSNGISHILRQSKLRSLSIHGIDLSPSEIRKIMVPKNLSKLLTIDTSGALLAYFRENCSPENLSMGNK